MEVLAERWAKGFPLWHPDDVVTYRELHFRDLKEEEEDEYIDKLFAGYIVAADEINEDDDEYF